MSTPLQLCILIFDDVVMAFKRESSPVWLALAVKGQIRYRHHASSNAVADILDDLSGRLNRQDQFQQVRITILYIENRQDMLEDCIRHLHRLCCRSWQIRGWLDVYQPACRLAQLPVSETIPDDNMLLKYVLPLIESNAEEEREFTRLLTDLASEKKTLEQSLKDQKSADEKDQKEMLVSISSLKQQMQLEVDRLNQQMAALERPTLEMLLTFLPSIFKDFWNKVRPDELAMMAGKLDTPNIPSPYHSPSMEAVLNKKRHYQQLGTQEQRRIQQFCRELSQSHVGLQVHPEFQALLKGKD